MRSDKTLKKWYSLINKKFFYGELPQNVVVRWSLPGEEKDVASLEKSADHRHSFILLLNKEKNPTLSIKLSSLLHEMIHVATGNRDDHGPLFEAWRVKLGSRGTFKKGALIKGTCLF